MLNDEIKQHLKETLDPWMEEVTKMSPGFWDIKNTMCLAGGAIASLLQNETPRDYNLFFTKASMVEWIKEYFTPETPGVMYVSQNAITLTNSLQLVTRQWGMPEVVVRGFDYTHTMAYFYQDQLHFVDFADFYARNKILKPNRETSYPLHPLLRLPKFIRRGYEIDRDGLVSLAQILSKLDMNDGGVIMEQLKGVYDERDLYGENHEEAINSIDLFRDFL